MSIWRTNHKQSDLYLKSLQKQWPKAGLPQSRDSKQLQLHPEEDTSPTTVKIGNPNMKFNHFQGLKGMEDHDAPDNGSNEDHADQHSVVNKKHDASTLIEEKQERMEEDDDASNATVVVETEAKDKVVLSAATDKAKTNAKAIKNGEQDSVTEQASSVANEKVEWEDEKNVVNSHNTTEFNPCHFRTYDSIRYYNVTETKEDFLSDAKYIRGQLPMVLNRGHSEEPTKVCMDTSEWEDVPPGRYPFSDGQNPSVVTLKSDPYNLQDESIPERLDRSHIEALVQVYGETDIENYYLGLMLFGEAQCKWGMSEDEIEEKRFSPLPKFPGKRTMLMMLNEDFQIIGQAPLKLEHDDSWGDNRVRYPRKESPDGKGFERSIVELDDARLFFHDGKIFVLYRNGPSFGYESKFLNQEYDFMFTEA